MMDALTASLLLARAPGVGPARFGALLARHGSAAAALAAGREAWRGAGVPEAGCAVLAAADPAGIEADLAWAQRPGNHLLCLGAAGYPPQLAAIADPPPLLWVHGDIGLLSDPQLAIVGTRRPTRSGRDDAHAFAGGLAAHGLAITSGLALGVDGAAHAGALAAGGRTLAVLGTGLDRVYPARHRDLAHAIADAQGALISEFPLGMPPLAENFPRRNRIIAGLSLGVLVVEAALQSGSLITARLAAEQGREVFALPGSIHNPLTRGCHALIREGAKLVETADEILGELAPHLHAALRTPLPAPAAEAAAASLPTPGQLDDDYRNLLDSMGNDPSSVDLLVQRSGLTAEVVSSMLLILELDGYVSSAPGGLFVRLV